MVVLMFLCPRSWRTTSYWPGFRSRKILPTACRKRCGVMSRRVRAKTRSLIWIAEGRRPLGPVCPGTGEQEGGILTRAQDRAPDRDILIEQIHRLRHQGEVEVDGVLDFMGRKAKVNAPLAPCAEVDKMA